MGSVRFPLRVPYWFTTGFLRLPLRALYGPPTGTPTLRLGLVIRTRAAAAAAVSLARTGSLLARMLRTTAGNVDPSTGVPQRHR